MILIASQFSRTATSRANLVTLVLIAFFQLAAATAPAQTTKPTEPVVTRPMPARAFNAQPLRRTTPSRGVTAESDATDEVAGEPAAKSPSSGFGTFRVLLSLGIVVALILAMKMFGQKLVPGGVAGRGSSRTVEMLSRSTIGPKQQVLLIRVGRRRVLVVSDCGGKLEPLDRITDADEITELTNQLVTEKSGTANTAFASLFGRSTEKFQANDPPEEADAEERKSSPVDDEMVDANVAATQHELQGLLAKVRKVSNKLGG